MNNCSFNLFSLNVNIFKVFEKKKKHQQKLNYLVYHVRNIYFLKQTNDFVIYITKNEAMTLQFYLQRKYIIILFFKNNFNQNCTCKLM